MRARAVAVAVGLLPTIAIAAAVEARTFECKTTDGVFRPAGETTLVPAGQYDPTVIGRVFMVEASRPGVI